MRIPRLSPAAHNRWWAPAFTFLTCLGLAFMLQQCGEEEEELPVEEQAESSTIEREFALAGTTHNIPSRLLLAVAFLESNIAEKPTHAVYLGRRVIPPNGETAFGISRAALELPAETGVDLQTQSDAYARWLAYNVEKLLVKDPQTDEEKMQWIFELARLHRKTNDTRALFARELIAILNKGFTWYDQRRHEYLTFPPESPSIDVTQLSKASQNRLQVDLKSAQSNLARTLVLPNRSGGSSPQQPYAVEIVHCPFGLSACLDLQINDNPSSTFALGAHYAIPQNTDLVDFPLQVSLHDEAVSYLDGDGNIIKSSDKVRIMLVGYSGRISSSKLQFVNPDWSSKWQLKTMGLLINDLCGELDKKRPTTLPQDGSYACPVIGQGVSVAHQKADEPFIWGQLFDYDPVIIASYLDTAKPQLDDTTLQLGEHGEMVEVGQPIGMNLQFNEAAIHLEMTRMFRCPDGNVLWSPVERAEVQGDTNYQFYNKRYWDGGANNTGEQFFKVKVYGKDNSFLGWDVVKLMVKNFQHALVPIPPDECFAGQ